ncbi:MAG: methyltransferase family protein [Rhodomicrobium sp.]
MSVALFVLGGILGLTLSGLLACTIASDKLRFWPTPGKGTWQSLLFWSLFRGLNVSAFVLAYVCFQPWQDFYAVRVLAAGVAIVSGVLYAWALHVLGRTNVYCGRDGLVTGGMYAWTRNPQYATAIPAFTGLAIASNSVAVYAVASLVTLCYALMAFAEERWLEAAYGADYLRYRREVARFYNWRHALALLKQEVMPARQAAEEPVSERP